MTRQDRQQFLLAKQSYHFSRKKQTMKIVDFIIGIIKSLFTGWIDRFKENNPSGYRVVVIILFGVIGLTGGLLASDLLPDFTGVLEIIAYAATSVLALFGISYAARSAYLQEFSKSGEVNASAVHTRTTLLTVLVILVFGAVVWLIMKNQPLPVPDQTEIVFDGADVDNAVSAPIDPDADPAKPLRSYIVTLLAVKDTIRETVTNPGFPTLKVQDREQYTFPLFPVMLDHVPVLEDFKGKLILKDGYEINRIVMIQIYPNQ